MFFCCVTDRVVAASFQVNFFTDRQISMKTEEIQWFSDRRKVFNVPPGLIKMSKNAFSARFGSNSPEKGWTASVARLYTLVRKPYLWCIGHAQRFWYGAHDQRVTHSCFVRIALISLSASSCTIENLFLEILMLTKKLIIFSDSAHPKGLIYQFWDVKLIGLWRNGRFPDPKSYSMMCPIQAGTSPKWYFAVAQQGFLDSATSFQAQNR